jgi:hypothetical protein
MECRDAQFYLRLRRHTADELGPDVTAALDGHCAGCPTCGPAARASATFDRALASAMLAVPVPSGLRERLITQAARARGAALRKKAIRAGGMMAAALLLVAIGLSLYTNTRPKVNSADLVQKAHELSRDREGYAGRWMAAQKLPEKLPPEWDFDYSLLVDCCFDRIGDRYVPVLKFKARTGNGVAKVYMFRDGGEFDTKELRAVQGSDFSAEVVVGKQRWRNVRYVAVHNGPPNEGGLRHFFRQPGPTA